MERTSVAPNSGQFEISGQTQSNTAAVDTRKKVSSVLKKYNRRVAKSSKAWL